MQRIIKRNSFKILRLELLYTIKLAFMNLNLRIIKYKYDINKTLHSIYF